MLKFDDISGATQIYYKTQDILAQILINLAEKS